MGYDNRGQVSVWKTENDNPKAPILKGTVIAHRDIREGEELQVSLWDNASDNPRAPRLKGKIEDKFKPKAEAPAPSPAPADFDDDLPF